MDRSEKEAMHIVCCINPACGRPFQSNRFQFSAQMALPWKRGEIACPHCSHVQQGEPESVFLNHALSLHEEADFFQRQPFGAGELPNPPDAGAPELPAVTDYRRRSN